jgi:HSP20 family protein
MTAVVRRGVHPVAGLLSWLDAGSVLAIPRKGLAPYIRPEDYVEDDSYVLRAEMPGVDPEKDVEIELVDDVLTMSYERKEEKRERNHEEFRCGSFECAVRLPRGTVKDKITAQYDVGVLS